MKATLENTSLNEESPLEELGKGWSSSLQWDKPGEKPDGKRVVSRGQSGGQR